LKPQLNIQKGKCGKCEDEQHEKGERRRRKIQDSIYVCISTATLDAGSSLFLKRRKQGREGGKVIHKETWNYKAAPL
jgi:hypothetical protein